jgi:deoxyribonuclease-4
LVIHPGSSKGARRESAIRRVADAVRAGIDATAGHPTRVLLETTAGAGNTLGGTFEELAELLSAIDRPERTGVCLDTCHVFVAGYDVKSAVGYERTFDRFEAAVGLDALFGFHVNDSKGGLGSRRDRHDQIGLGHIGSRAFGRLLRDERFRHLPFVLETPKTRTPDGREYDAVNIAKLRRMAKNPVNLRNLR